MNRTGVFTVFSAVAVSTTKSWTAGEFPLYEVEVTTSGFSGTLDLQSAHTDTAAEYQNTRYLERIASAAPSTAQLSYTTNTSRKTYYVLANSYLRAVMVRTAGSITLKARGLSVLLDSLMFEAAPMSLADGSDVAEGATTDAAATAGGTGTLSAKLRRATQGLEDLKSLIVLAAGTNRIGKVTVRNSADAADIDPLAEATFTGRLGEVQVTPTSNTVLARLKDLLTGISLAAGTNVIGKVGIDQTTPGTTNLVDTELPAAAALSDTLANPTTPLVGASLLLYNPTSAQWERGRNTGAAPAAIGNTGIAATAAMVNVGGQYGPLYVRAANGGSGDGKADNTGNALDVANFGWLFNGATWDRWRNNVEGTLLASAARTAAVQTATQTNHNARGAALFLNITAASGTGGLLPRFLAIDSISGSGARLNPTPTAVTATGLYAYLLYPGVSGGAIQQATSSALPRSWAVLVDVGDASSYTYSLGFALIL